MQLDQPIALSPIPLDDLSARIGQDTSQGLLASMPEIIRRSRLGEYMDDDQFSYETGLSKRQIRHLRDTRQISYVKRGRTIRYLTREVFAFMDAGRIPARDPIQT